MIDTNTSPGLWAIKTRIIANKAKHDETPRETVCKHET